MMKSNFVRMFDVDSLLVSSRSKLKDLTPRDRCGYLIVFLGAMVILSNSFVTGNANAQQITEDAKRLNSHWGEAVRWVINGGTSVTNEAIYKFLENYCKEWRWPKKRCKQAFSDLIVFREKYF